MRRGLVELLLGACLGRASASLGASSSARRVTFFVKHQARLQEELLEKFHQVSDPRHENYGRHLPFGEVARLQRPRPEHVAAVREHVRSLGGVEVAASIAEDKIVALLPSSQLGAVREPPARVRAAIDTVAGPMDGRGRPRRSPRRPRHGGRRTGSAVASLPDPQKCLAERAVPPCIRKAYGLEGAVGSAAKNGQAVIVNQGFKSQDLVAFCREYGLHSCVEAVTEVGTNTGEAGDEASLDVQYISATGQGVPLWWVYIDGHSANPFSDWITWASNTSTIPWVHSLSVGEPEDEFAQDNGGPASVERMNAEMMAMGARGVSIIFASGDSGYNVAQKYGSSSPYVTSLGGVFNGELGDDVLQVDDTSTGGFSSLSANALQPWQKGAVESWLGTKGARPDGFNSSRRCCPDLAIYDAGFYIVQGGSDSPIGGTSAAAPTFAGMISLINDALLSAGKPPLGFLNYFLYQNPDAFLDITKGGNNGFDATVGYDPASGLGTFSPTTFSQLKAAALARHRAPSEEARAAAGPPPTLLVGLRHTTQARGELERRFWAAADPTSRETQVSGVSQIADIVQADPATLAAAKEWLRAIGADLATLRLVPTGDALEVAWPAGAGAHRAPKVPVSSSFSDYVILRDGRPLAEGPQKATRGFKGAVMDNSMGPSAQKAAYGVPPSLKGTNKANVQMVFGTGTFGYREDDISMFFDQYAPTSSVKDVSFDSSNKWKGETGKNFVEGELDVSYIAAFAPGVKTLVANSNTSAATEAGEGFGAALLAFLVELNGRDEVPLVLSMSLGSLSYGACDKVCHALAHGGGHTYEECWSYLQTQFQACMFDSGVIEQRIDAELAKLGLRGVTVTAASGDGASHFAFGPFTGGIGEDLNSIICKEMNMPVYPACSPYVLSVGGTQWTSDDMYGPVCSADAPCAWTDGGGGFSWQHPQPGYQNKTSSKYLALGEKVAPTTMPPASTYNAAGRGYPDVAALAHFGIPLCDYGGCSGAGGTSASAPTVAGMLSLINDARLNKGLKPLGFINTKLYALMEDPETFAECFSDVGIDRVGDQWDCQTYSSCDGCSDGGGAGRGFVATKGWDAQTGFGQPKFEGWMKHLGSDSLGPATAYV